MRYVSSHETGRGASIKREVTDELLLVKLPHLLSLDLMDFRWTRFNLNSLNMFLIVLQCEST